MISHFPYVLLDFLSYAKEKNVPSDFLYGLHQWKKYPALKNIRDLG